MFGSFTPTAYFILEGGTDFHSLYTDTVLKNDLCVTHSHSDFLFSSIFVTIEVTRSYFVTLTLSD